MKFKLLLFLFIGYFFSDKHLKNPIQFEVLSVSATENFPTINSDRETYWYKVIVNQEVRRDHLIFDTQQCFINDMVIYDHNLKPINFEICNYKTNSYKVRTTKKGVYYLSLNFDKASKLDLTINSVDTFEAKKAITLFWDGGFLGFVIVVLVVNIFFYFSLKDKVFLYYSMLLFAINFYFICLDGYWLHTFPKNQRTIGLISDVSTTISATLFTYNFFDLRNSRYYRRHLIFICSMCISIACLFTLSRILKDFFYESIADLLGLICLLYLWMLGVVNLKKNQFAKFFVLGYSLAVLIIILYFLISDFGIIDYKPTVGDMRMGVMFEMLILTYAITYRVKIMQADFDSVQEELNDYIQKINKLTNNKEETRNLILKKSNLTKREKEIYLLLLENLMYKEIAERLFVSHSTVKFHVRNIYEKLDVKNKKDLKNLTSSPSL